MSSAGDCSLSDVCGVATRARFELGSVMGLEFSGWISDGVLEVSMASISDSSLSFSELAFVFSGLAFRLV